MDNTAYEHDMRQYNNNTKDAEARTEIPLSEQEIKAEKKIIYKNVLLISISFLLLFVAFESMSKLQSSINVVNNLGTWANAAVYASLILSCMFMPSIMIKMLKVKWTLVICIFCYSTYIAAQFYPQFYTLLPTAFILGMGAAPMWSAKCTYLTQVAHRFAGLEGVDPEPVVVKFFGIFFFFFQCNSIIGNIISTSVLSSGKTEVYTELSDAAMARCGSAYCPAQLAVSSNITLDPTSGLTESPADVENDNFKTDITKIYIIAGIYLACSFSAALIIALFVDPLTRFGEDERQEGKPTLSGKDLLVATFRQMKKKKQILIIPLTFWSGIEQGFFGADFTAGFVTCAYGVHIVGRVLIVFGICDALASIGFGFIIKKVGRVPIFILGACINVLVIIIMLSWTPTSSAVGVVYLLAALWGMADAIWQTQINALYGVLFASDEEAAFSNYRLWESMGFLLAFITQASGVCVLPKLILALFILAFAMVGYLLLELMERKEARSSHTN
eukprot:TRINITY_DN3833_c0_g1_i1.p1 TRINITY_DN3833_c0_g1~~TRINITY_DN3833_c0_g1_i1.p1  ORF type:complete len:502 (-),score=112.42 TRINITY_DN3833_c0_g1_i1:104-1609(-)